MAKTCFVPRNFYAKNRVKLDWIDVVFREYAGRPITLRNLFYRLDHHGVIKNTRNAYNALMELVTNGRNAGEIDWDAIKETHRDLRRPQSWSRPEFMMAAVPGGYHIDMWANQPIRPEVWIEKEAQATHILDVCWEHSVPLLSCLGFASTTEKFKAGYQRMRDPEQEHIIFYCGDHDPGGVYMPEDIDKKVNLYAGGGVEVKVIALTMDQVEEHALTESFDRTKPTDNRSKRYLREFGDACWELDALPPGVLAEIVEDTINSVRDPDLWEEALEVQEEHRAVLQRMSDYWDEIQDFLGDA